MHVRSTENTDPDNGPLKYRPSDAQTMAVSHVWIAGMGGRPERGTSACLHDRFAAIARVYGRQSYWMDTPSIPWRMSLRREAMEKIETFIYSKFTLVCDQDVQEVDISSARFDIEPADQTMVRCAESILAALLVSDWNVRAILIIKVIKVVHDYGAVDMGGFWSCRYVFAVNVLAELYAFFPCGGKQSMQSQALSIASGWIPRDKQI